MLEKSSHDREAVINYIQAMLIGGSTKKDAYRKYINADIKDVKGAVSRLEKSAVYKNLYESVVSDDGFKLDKTVAKVRQQYADLVSQNIDAASEVLTTASKEKDLVKKGAAVRLVNETITALGFIAQTPDKDTDANGNKLNRGSVVLS